MVWLVADESTPSLLNERLHAIEHAVVVATIARLITLEARTLNTHYGSTIGSKEVIARGRSTKEGVVVAIDEVLRESWDAVYTALNGV